MFFVPGEEVDLAPGESCAGDLGTPLFAAADETRGGGGKAFFKFTSDKGALLDCAELVMDNGGCFPGDVCECAGLVSPLPSAAVGFIL